LADPFAKQERGDFVASLGEQPRTSAGRWWLFALCALAFLAGGAWYVVALYNTIQANDERVDAEWQHVVTQYRRRTDLVPNLIAIVKSYAAHESRLFNDIAAARARANQPLSVPGLARDPAAMGAFQESQRELSRSLGHLLAVAEGYPELKADGLYRDLMAQLEGTENRIAYARHRHVEAVAAYNLDIKRFPANLIAARYGFEVRPRLVSDDDPTRQPAPGFESR
jgi:LemA protein